MFQINVKFLKTETQQESTNVKFWFSVNIKERIIKGVSKLLKLKNNDDISKILSIPEMAINTNKILLPIYLFPLLQILLTFDEDENNVKIDIPILNEKFNIVLLDQLTIVIGVVEYIPQLLQLIEEVEEYIPQLLHNFAKVLEYIPGLLLRIKYHCRCLDHRSKHLH